jgi:hypothetical protein
LQRDIHKLIKNGALEQVLLLLPSDDRYVFTLSDFLSLYPVTSLITGFRCRAKKIGGMILGWVGAIESLLVVILTTIGLSHVPQVSALFSHLRTSQQ